MVRKRILVGVAMALACVVVARTLLGMTDAPRRPLPVVARAGARVWAWLSPRRAPQPIGLTGLTDPERAAVRSLARRLDGLIVWSSNRSGTHQLYLLDLHAQSVRQLTHDDHVKFYARFSPDGRMVAYMRSQPPSVSYRDETAWDVYLMRVDGRGERLVARQGYAPAWTPDGRAILFSRGNRTIRVPIDSGREEVLFDADQSIPGGRVLGVILSPDESRLAFSIRGVYDGVAVYDRAARRMIPLTREQACQVIWGPGGQTLAWVEVGGNGGTRIMTGQPDGTGRRVLMDLPGEYSHEYFPQFSNDGRWLIWGAAAHGHEHDQADYEIFLWEVGTPWEEAVRLTYHPGNDQWPDLYVRTPGRASR